MRKRNAVSSTANVNANVNPDSAEPVGIVISSGSRREDTPWFAAYVWGPVPDAALIDELVAVA